MIRAALAFALLSTPALADTLVLREDRAATTQGPALRQRCETAVGDRAWCQAASRRRPIETRALDACLSFKSEEDNHTRMDDDRSQAEMQPRLSRDRFLGCVNALQGKRLNGAALEACGLAGDFAQHVQCLGLIADHAYMNEAVEICKREFARSRTAGLDCMDWTADQVYTRAELRECGTQVPAASRSLCLRKENPDLRECRRNLSDVQGEITALARVAGSRSQKQALESILQMLERPQGPAHSAQ